LEKRREGGFHRSAGLAKKEIHGETQDSQNHRQTRCTQSARSVSTKNSQNSDNRDFRVAPRLSYLSDADAGIVSDVERVGRNAFGSTFRNKGALPLNSTQAEIAIDFSPSHFNPRDRHCVSTANS
jgi:hypothetical protein